MSGLAASSFVPGRDAGWVTDATCVAYLYPAVADPDSNASQIHRATFSGGSPPLLLPQQPRAARPAARGATRRCREARVVQRGFDVDHMDTVVAQLAERRPAEQVDR